MKIDFALRCREFTRPVNHPPKASEVRPPESPRNKSGQPEGCAHQPSLGIRLSTINHQQGLRHDPDYVLRFTFSHAIPLASRNPPKRPDLSACLLPGQARRSNTALN